MSKLTREQIASYASKAGFSGNNLNIAVAVALAESGGNTQSHNSTPPDDSYGLMQINMLGSLGPDRREKFSLSANTDLYDPATNMRVAYGIYKGSGWKAWTTYTRGTYKKFLNGTDDTVSSDSADTSSPATPVNVNPINGISSAINAFGETIFKGFANTAGIAVAIALIVLGAVFLLRDVIPVGKAAKLAKKVVS